MKYLLLAILFVSCATTVPPRDILIIEKPYYDIVIDEKLFQSSDAGLNLADRIRYAGDEFENTNVNVFIRNNGGSVRILLDLIEATKKRTYKTTCYVERALSASFTFMLTYCDKIYPLLDFDIGTHFVYNGGDVDDVSLRYTHILAKIEAQITGFPVDYWISKTRSRLGGRNEMVRLSHSQIKKLNIADKVVIFE